MNLNQLYYLQAIAQARGLTRAADALYVTQSNLSHSMAALEEELGITIFTRSSTGIAITNEGRELLKLSNRLLRDADYISEYFHSDTEQEKPSFFLSSQRKLQVNKIFSQRAGQILAEQLKIFEHILLREG